MALDAAIANVVAALDDLGTTFTREAARIRSAQCNNDANIEVIEYLNSCCGAALNDGIIAMTRAMRAMRTLPRFAVDPIGAHAQLVIGDIAAMPGSAATVRVIQSCAGCTDDPRTWGGRIFQFGKHTGRTFAEIYDVDHDYTAYLKKSNDEDGKTIDNWDDINARALYRYVTVRDAAEIEALAEHTCA
jgi:hypothetical protein